MKTNLQIFMQGKEISIPIELNADQLNEIALAMKSDDHLTGWEKPDLGSPCYYEDALSRIQKVVYDENSEIQVDLLHSKANCYLSEKIASDIARADALTRNLRRYSILNRKNKIDREGNGGYTITYNYVDKCLEIGVTGSWFALGDIVFDSEETARKAMNENASELIWYFTEMEDTI